MKKLFSIALALVMILSLATVAFAAKADLEGHTYRAYQIFAGTFSQAEGEKSQLSNIEWGNGVKSEDLLEALQSDETFGNAFAESKTASEVAEVLAANDKFATDSEWSRHFAYIVSQHLSINPTEIGENTVLDDGYYLIVDVTDVSNKDDVANLSLLQVTDGEVNITSKVEKPTLVKKVKDTNDSTGATSGWQDSADHDIGDKVPYQITVTLPSDFNSYEVYYVQVNDYMSKGLTYNNDYQVYIVNGDSDPVKVTGNFTMTTAENSDETYKTKVTFTCEDLNKIQADGLTIDKDSKIVIEYTCELNDKAVIGFKGNPNKAELIYSNNPNYGHENDTGKTPEDKVIVFTYELEVNKVDKKTNDPLKGAGFTLFKYDVSVEGEDQWVKIGNEVKGEDLTTFTFKGLDDGKYKLSETTTPDGYNTIEDIVFEISATHDEQSDDPQLTEISINDENFTADKENEKYTGKITTIVENAAGSQLPETGGIGTTIFYVLGALMVVGAAVLLVTKKRMSAAE